MKWKCLSCFLPVLFLFIVPQGRAQEHHRFVYPYFTKDDTARIRSFIRTGINLLYINTDSAIVLFTKAEELSRLTGFSDGIGYALAFKGVATTDRGYYDSGMAYYKEAFPYCVQARYIPNALPSLYINMGVSFFHAGDYTKANDYYYRALRYLQQYFPNNENIAVVYNNLATVQKELGMYQQSLSYSDEAEKRSVRANMNIILGATWINKGTVYSLLQKEDSAAHYFSKALELGKKVKYIELQQAALTCMGDLLLQEKKYAEALPYYNKAMALSVHTSPFHASIMPGYSMGIALYYLKQYPEAERRLLATLAQSSKTGILGRKQEAHATLARLYEATGRYKDALQQQKFYVESRDSYFTIEKLRSVKEIEAKYLTAQKDKEIAERGLTIAQQQQRLERKNLLVGALVAGIVVVMLSLLFFYKNRKKINNRDREIERLKAVMTGEEKERGRLSRELHDGIGGMLTGIKMNLKMLQKRHEQGPITEGLEEIMVMLQGMGDEIHKTAHNLMPDILLKHTLEDALRLYCEHLDATGHKLKVDLYFYGSLEHLDTSLSLQIYRIIQELLQNVVKHADASHADVQVRITDEGLICVSAEDNGVGFDARKSYTGLGVQNIRARVQALGGYFTIESAAGRGTTAYMEIDGRKLK